MVESSPLGSPLCGALTRWRSPNYITIVGQSSICSATRKTACQQPGIELQIPLMKEIQTGQDSRTAPNPKDDNWWEFCPVCSSKLVNHRCRFVCSNPICRFFMSCSEFDM
jgi:hypothetical protein